MHTRQLQSGVSEAAGYAAGQQRLPRRE
jgi:hypothetical protein